MATRCRSGLAGIFGGPGRGFPWPQVGRWKDWKVAEPVGCHPQRRPNRWTRAREAAEAAKKLGRAREAAAAEAAKLVKPADGS